MEAAHTLLRTAIRTFYPTPRHILILDALVIHHVLHLEDFNILLSAQSKEIRTFLHPLRLSRFIATHSRREVRVTGTISTHAQHDRAVNRDYYFVNVKEAIDAVKYRTARLRKLVEGSYKQDETRGKDWYCPRCKSEYDMMEVLGFKQGEGGFECAKCGFTLVQDEERMKDRGSGKKMMRLNEQLGRLDELIARVDKAVEDGRLNVGEQVGADGKMDGGFAKAWAERVPVKRGEGQGKTNEERYMEAKDKREKGPDQVKAENLDISLKSERELTEEGRRLEAERREKIRLQNLMPEWHAQSAIGPSTDAGQANGDVAVKAEEDEKKPDTAQSDADLQMQQYLALIEKERAEEEERKKQEESEDDFDEDDDGAFEDALGTSVVGTPASTQELKPTNGVKRELEEDSSEAATPASFQESKRVKVEENGVKPESNGTNVAKAEDEDSDEDEGDFVDV